MYSISQNKTKGTNILMKKNSTIKEILYLFIIGICLFFITTIPFLGGSDTEQGWAAFFSVLIEYFFIYLFTFITKDLKISIYITLGINVAFTGLNFYVFACRGRQIYWNDIYSIKTALEVADNYSLNINNWVLFAAELLLLITAVIIIICLTRKIHTINLSKRVYNLIISVLCAITVWIAAGQYTPYLWNCLGAITNGPMFEILIESRQKIEPPQNLELADAILENATYQAKHPQITPNKIIVIMNEAFCDPEMYFNNKITNSQIIPFYEDLKKESMHGYAYSSVYGGNTCVSEWEFLTGSTMHFMPMWSVPYQQYINDYQESLVSTLKSSSYQTLAAHPGYKESWNRENVYKYFGFDNYISMDDFPENKLSKNYKRELILPDYLFYEQIKHEINNNKQFIFGITIQNHGPYDTKEITSTQYTEDEQINEYLTELNMSDNALGDFITYLKTLNEPIMLVFFSDHNPHVETYAPSEENRYKVPFLIWKNYENTEERLGLTSLNYLSSIVLEQAGVSLPKYNQYLLSLRNSIPIVQQEFIITQEGEFYNRNNVPENYQSLLNEYNAVQYQRR